MSHPLTLADVVARSTPVEWFEGVAIAQALCDAVAGLGGRGARVPNLDAIEIRPAGSIGLSEEAGRTGESAVQGVGRVLLTLVPEHRMPVQLRLLGLTALSPTSSYGTVMELSAALDYFARPDRAAQIRNVHDRCAALPAPAIHEDGVRPESAGSSAPDQARPRVARRRRGVSRFIVLGTAVVLIAAGLAAAWAFFGLPSPIQGGRTGLVQAVSSAAAKAGDAAATAARSVGQRLGLATPAPAPPPPASAEATAAPASRRPTASQKAELPRVLPVVAWKPVIADPVRVDETVVAGISNGDSFSPVPGGAYYTAADVAVEPPALLRPRLPRVPPSGSRLADLPHVDVLVTETGEVEWVRLWPADVSVHSAMMLSAIKNWRFEPARKDGHPVRYRQTIALTSQ